MRVATNEATGERNSVAKLLDRLVLLEPHETGETITRFSNGEPSRWVDCHAWFVDRNGTPTPIGDDGGTAIRIWAEVLTPTLAAAIGEPVAARIIRPGTAYLFDELDADEIGRCEKAEARLTGEGPF